MREYHPTWGRWLSPDPAGLAAANPANPQTWNRYAYVADNPLALTDPEGLGRCVPGAPNYENDCQPPSGEGYTGDSYSEWPVNNMDPACGANVPWSYERYHMCGSELATLPLRPIGPKMMKSLLPQTPKCTALQQQASQLALTLNQASHSAGLGAAGLGVLSGVSFVAGFFTAEGTAPITIALGGGSAVFEAIGKSTGGAAAALNSFAEGNPKPLANFSFNQPLVGTTKLLASKVSPVAEFGVSLLDAVKQAQDLAKAAKGVCQ